MMENIGLAAMMETPCVVVNVQRGGPSTGLPTMVGQADMMQARWGSHGDYEPIALCPQSPQEAFDLTIDAFNLSEKYRVPVMFMMDECVGHMTEKVVIPEAESIEVVPRKLTSAKPGDYLPYGVNGKPGREASPFGGHWEAKVAKTEIVSGVCGFRALVEARMDGRQCILTIDSDCDAIQRLSQELTKVEPFQEITFRGHGPLALRLGAKHCYHPACPVPVGIIKTVEVEAGLALPAEATIRPLPPEDI